VAIVTANEGVRMRTEPSLEAPSERYTPMLPKGADLYVISGPEHGSGYHWYEVSPLGDEIHGLIGSSRPPEHAYTGWVAVASRDGEPWLAHRKVNCPNKPRDVTALTSLSGLEGLTCFSRVRITVRARILPCGCSTTGPCDWGNPAWFWNWGEYLVIVPPTTRQSDSSPRGGIELVVEGGGSPHSMPIDKVVTVTGMFNHPAAATCQVNSAAGSDGDPVWWPAGSCRTRFVVTSIR
jgi:hypothetical protein